MIVRVAAAGNVPRLHGKAVAQSPERQAAGADVPNFATGGVTMFIAHD